MSIPQLKNPKKLSYNELREQVSELARRMNILTDMRAVPVDYTAAAKFTFSDSGATLDVPRLDELIEQLEEAQTALEECETAREECDAALVTCEEIVTGLEEDIVDLENSLTASGGCTSFGYGIYQYNMMNGNVCISTYTNPLGQKRLKMDWVSTGNQVIASPGGGGTGFVRLFCNVWSDTARTGQVSWGNNDNILMPYRYSTPIKGPVRLSESRNSNNYPIGASSTHIRLTPQTDSTYIAGIIRISDIPEFFSLTYSAGTGGSVEGELSQNVLKAEDGTAVTATSDAGYTFTGWSDGSTANPRTDTNVTSYVNVTANFAPIEN